MRCCHAKGFHTFDLIPPRSAADPQPSILNPKPPTGGLPRRALPRLLREAGYSRPRRGLSLYLAVSLSLSFSLFDPLCLLLSPSLSCSPCTFTSTSLSPPPPLSPSLSPSLSRSTLVAPPDTAAVRVHASPLLHPQKALRGGIRLSFSEPFHRL